MNETIIIEDKENVLGISYSMEKPPNKLIIQVGADEEWVKETTIEWSNCTYIDGKRWCEVK